MSFHEGESFPDFRRMCDEHFYPAELWRWHTCYPVDGVAVSVKCIRKFRNSAGYRTFAS